MANELLRLGVALMAGLLIGIDRERAEQRKAREIYGGVRTFPLIALSGCVPMLVLDTAGPWVIVVAFAGIAAITAIAYWRGSRDGHVGATTEVAGIATFLVGMLAGSGRLFIAGAAGLVVATLLVAKPRLEAISRAMKPAEVTAVLKLAVISGIILPILPNHGIGPWNALNPREIWLIVVLVTGLSFVGFVAGRLLGEERGLTVTGLLGGLASSTAVTVAMAERSKESAQVAAPAAAAAVLASSVMAVRMAIFAGVVNREILPRLAPVCGVMALSGLVSAWLIARVRHRKAHAPLRNPFSLGQALIFAVIYALILLAVRVTQQWLSSGAMFATATLGGVADVDAVTIAFAQLDPGSAGWRIPAAAISLAAVINTLTKLGIAWARGSPAFRRPVAASLGVMALVGAAAGMTVFVLG